LLKIAQRFVTLDLFNTIGVIFLNPPLLEKIIFISRAGKYYPSGFRSTLIR